MSARRPWPEGVPVIPTWCRFWELRNRWWDDRWLERIGPFTQAQMDANPLPMVYQVGERVAMANAAARALGIVPDEEVAPRE